MAIGSELWTGNTLVTQSNPGGPGVNVYATLNAGGSGTIPVEIVSGSSAAVHPSSSLSGSYAYSITSRQILLDNPDRIGFKVYNDTANTLVLSFAATASLGRITCIVPAQFFYEDPYPCWTGPVSCIGFGAGSGTIYVTELN